MGSMHRCPSCGTVGRVNRSKLRNFKERLVSWLVPVYRVYRCHHCNWRGWLPRSGASRQTVRLIVGGYILVVVLVLAVAAFMIWRYWPHAQFKY